jgi:hypothetical protein
MSLPVPALREDTLVLRDFGRWIVKNVNSCFAFARNLGLGIEKMEEIILVTGCDRTRSWANIAFLGDEVDAQPAQPAQVSFGVKVEGLGTDVYFQFSPEDARGDMLRLGPQGKVRLYAV